MNTGKPKILIINGSIRGKKGNSWRLSKLAEAYLSGELSVSTSILNLSEPKSGISQVRDLLAASDGFLIVTGSYWNSWGSSLQRFIEVITTFENDAALFGKPIACAVTTDSVGGTEVASGIHTVFSGLGCWSPPCSTLVISRVGQEAIVTSQGQINDPNEDVWRVDDLEIVLKNLAIASTMKRDAWVAWPHTRLKLSEDKWPESGDLDLGSSVFLPE